MRPTRRNSSDSHLRELERRVLAGDLTAVSALARVYERVARGEPPFDVTEQTRRLVADVERVEETGEHGSIRDVLTELVHLARERNANIEEMLEAAIDTADEEEASTPCPDCGGERTPAGRGRVPGFFEDVMPGGRRRQVATTDPCEHECHDGSDEEDDGQEDDPHQILGQRCQGRMGVGPFEMQCEGTVPCTFHEIVTRRRHDGPDEEDEDEEDERRMRRCRACINGFPLELDACPSCGRTRE